MDYKAYEKALNDLGRYAAVLVEQNRSKPKEFTAEEILRQLIEEYDRLEQRHGEWPYKNTVE